VVLCYKDQHDGAAYGGIGFCCHSPKWGKFVRPLRLMADGVIRTLDG
jgi:hypothetical protein